MAPFGCCCSTRESLYFLFFNSNVLNNTLEKYPIVKVQSTTPSHKFPKNTVKTTKYNVFTFPFKFLYYQYKLLTNVYFLINMIISCIPYISTVTPITAIIPIVVVLAVSAVREIVEDLKRYSADNKANGKKYTVLKNGEESVVCSKNISVGSVLKLHKDQVVPADVVPIFSSLPDGVCKLDTAALDGETSLKTIFVPKMLLDMTEKDVTDFSMDLECEWPRAKFNDFKGLFSSETVKIALDEKNLLLRGSVLRKTEYVYCVVCYTGKYTKQALNSTKPVNKSSILNTRLNQFVLSTVFFQLLICSILAALSTWRYTVVNPDTGFWYLDSYLPELGYAAYAVKKFFGFFNLISYTIPISVGVTMEICRYVQGFVMEMDADFKIKKVDSEGVEKDEGMRTNSCALIEEMGEVQYILSDKTGTLTENKMSFSKCSIGGEVISDVMNGTLGQLSETNKMVSDFLMCLVLCNTCSKEKDQVDGMKYSSLSPDEEALCEAAYVNGVILEERTQKTVKIQNKGENEEYTIVIQIEFTSARKMMSVLVEKDGEYVLYSKGADSAISTLLHHNTKGTQKEINIGRLDTVELSEEEEMIKKTQQQVDAFGNEGLRTLFIARRKLSKEYVDDWKRRLDAIDPLAENVKELRYHMYKELECDLELIGATAIEDQLQEGVPETIDILRRAGLKIWVLTGDKKETATSVAKSCKLFDLHQNLLSFNFESEEAFLECANAAMAKINELKDTKEIAKEKHKGKPSPTTRVLEKEMQEDVKYAKSNKLGIVISDTNIEYLIRNYKVVKPLFIQAESVVCCRVSPRQKADIALLVKRITNKSILTIGDGMNDVPMITKGDVGVGIFGKEGNQAAVTADFAIQKFRHLTKLVLFYGRNARYQVSSLIKFCFYKNAAFFLLDVSYAFMSNFTCQILFDDWIMTCFNILFTSLPPGAIALFDYELSWNEVKQFPESHKETFNDPNYKIKSYVEWYLYGVLQSILFFVLFYFLIAGSDVTNFDGKVNGFPFSVVTVTTYSLTSIWVTMLIYTKRFSILVVLSFVASIILYIIIYTLVMFISGLSVRGISAYGWYIVLQQPSFYLICIIAVSVTTLPQIGALQLHRRVVPTNSQLIQEYTKWKLVEHKELPEIEMKFSQARPISVILTKSKLDEEERKIQEQMEAENKRRKKKEHHKWSKKSRNIKIDKTSKNSTNTTDATTSNSLNAFVHSVGENTTTTVSAETTSTDAK
ncbi:phospholipid-transporting ATPase, putative [Entamoeba invadens IP1]|uniref:Phospholipid-transporting ATPase n=1 Tax=Entamoeba invadens IP1 TaxID=370355 RepID=A0A0A1UED5_ENTIV|nr:phospholipid-transporting ATPase, putative [Entamoeba invadens IP1]ELP94848.1 phospholipid-transporting ATPase, putative [Entamoeba invadens IP1]|eukprot:XP_004261619.1 phospholipid-transporting ATPase, putative [Entamoeba invadens IP1]